MLTTNSVLQFSAGIPPSNKTKHWRAVGGGEAGVSDRLPLCVIRFQGPGTSFQEDAWKVTSAAAGGPVSLDDFPLVTS